MGYYNRKFIKGFSDLIKGDIDSMDNNNQDKKKSIFFKIIFNLLIISILFVFTDFISSLFQYKSFFKSFEDKLKQRTSYTLEEHSSPPLLYNYTWKISPFREYYKKYIISELATLKRRIIPQKSSKKSIVIFGCSFAEGANLKNNETFGYKLSKITNRPVYNLGLSGFGLSETVFLSKLNDFYSHIKVQPEYAVYVYIPDQIRRIYADRYGLDKNVYLNYEFKDGKLEEKNAPFLQLSRFYLFKTLFRKKIDQYISDEKNCDKHFDLLKIYFNEIRNELRKKYPKIKFIIIKYPSSIGERDDVYMGHGYNYTFYTDRWKELGESGFIIYDLSDKIKVNLQSEEYTVFDGHPNAKAWDIITKKLKQDIRL